MQIINNRMMTIDDMPNLTTYELKLLNCLKHYLTMVNEAVVTVSVKIHCFLASGISEGLYESICMPCVEAAKTLQDLAWEWLNTGHWKDVGIDWRYVYSIATLSVALVECRLGHLSTALMAVDKVLIFGAPFASNVSEVAHEIHAELRSVQPTSSYSCEIKDRPLKKMKTAKCTVKNQVQSEEFLDLLDFENFYLANEKPVLITSGIEHWPAVQKWNVDYIRHVAGFRTVPVEIGSKYTEDSWTQSLITINEFIDQFMVADSTPNPVGYLAQHELFDQILELKHDILIPDYCYISSENPDEISINAWFGPAGTTSPLHFDPRNNILVQIFGSKYVRLYPPSAEVYPLESSIMSNTSQVDVENPDFEQYPLFEHAPFYECILEQGQQLFIPKKWWHFVKSLEPSFSISYWF